MASKFSSHVVSRDCLTDHNDHLTHSPCVSYSNHFAHVIPNPCSAIELIRLLIATIVNPCSRHTSYPFMEPRRMAPMRP